MQLAGVCFSSLQANLDIPFSPARFTDCDDYSSTRTISSKGAPPTAMRTPFSCLETKSRP